ncbi:MAG: OmpA family protein [Crocinitomicaceae bacterium]|nr:OmpA family protein [Crocinitomicaceae bacterium]MBK8926249.1 OmpA family protein [Crocinitomicaceae bacterium]
MERFFKILSILLLFAGVLLSSSAYSQDGDEEEDEKEEKVERGKEKKFLRKGRNAYRKGEYWKAKSFYDKVVAENPTKPQYWLETGMVYYDSEVEREKSLTYFLKALELSVDDTMPEILYYTAKAYHFNGEYEKAIEFYTLFLNDVKNNKKGMELRQEVIREIEVCNNGVDLRGKTTVKDATVVNMGDKVNSDYPDYVPVVTNNEDLILFCSRRPPGKKKNLDGLYFEDIFYTTNKNGVWQQAEVINKSSGYLNKEINDGKAHEAPISLSPDGNTLYIYKENSVWKSVKDESGKWSIPVRMNQNVNIGDANPSIFITPDEQEMFIVSVGAEGGYGERDIYYSRKNENGTWDKPVNLGPVINTPYKEDAPFLSKDGKTLYFASQGHNSMGGFDIFKSVRDENGNWSEPINIGAPINSAGDDIYYVENEDGTLAYYASMRPGSYGYLDLYTASFGCKNLATTTIKGYAIFEENHLPVNGYIKVTNKTTGEVMGTYNIDPKTGKYTMVLPPNQTYYLELTVSQSKYNELRPHREEFFIPEQCEQYNLFQQITVDYLKDEDGQVYAQRAVFKNAMFDIEAEIEKTYGSKDFTSAGTTQHQGISGHLAHNNTLNARYVEVVLMNENHQILRMTHTDEHGNFTFEKIDPYKTYIVMINEDDAKASYFGDNFSSGSTVTVSGIIREFKDEISYTPRPNVTVYFGNTGRKITNTIVTDGTGKFEFTNVSSTPDVVATLNNKTVSYNLDMSNVEVAFSAYIMYIDPKTTELAYTEYVDIIELRDMLPPGGGQEFANILFDFDKFFLRDKSKNVLDDVYNFMKANPNVTLRLDGHTDWFGSEPYNEKLSERRALSAHKYLIDKGIAPNRIKNQWFGETRPAYDNMAPDGSDSPDNRQLNRRVEIKIEIPEMADLYLSL